jgi:hypothetical protein
MTPADYRLHHHDWIYTDVPTVREMPPRLARYLLDPFAQQEDALA